MITEVTKQASSLPCFMVMVYVKHLCLVVSFRRTANRATVPLRGERKFVVPDCQAILPQQCSTVQFLACRRVILSSLSCPNLLFIFAFSISSVPIPNCLWMYFSEFAALKRRTQLAITSNTPSPAFTVSKFGTLLSHAAVRTSLIRGHGTSKASSITFYSVGSLTRFTRARKSIGLLVIEIKLRSWFRELALNASLKVYYWFGHAVPAFSGILWSRLAVRVTPSQAFLL